MSIKHYAIGIAVIFALMFANHYRNLVADKAVLASANKTLTKERNKYKKDAEDVSTINVEKQNKVDKLNKSLEKSKNEIKKLKLTPKQSACMSVPLPSGYHDRLQWISN